jgi:hypothetical protein
MKAISPIFKDRDKEDKGGYMLVLVTVLTLAFCLFIAYTAFASTEAGQDKRESKCKLEAVANKFEVTKAATYHFSLSFKDHADIARQMKRQAERALTGGYDSAAIYCKDWTRGVTYTYQHTR